MTPSIDFTIKNTAADYLGGCKVIDGKLLTASSQAFKGIILSCGAK